MLFEALYFQDAGCQLMMFEALNIRDAGCPGQDNYFYLNGC
jgi:hypothetical protein